jgi:hypothetical protein
MTMDVTHAVWRKASYSGGNNQCVELAAFGAVRDSKNPSGPILAVDVQGLVAAVKAGNLGG